MKRMMGGVLVVALMLGGCVSPASEIDFEGKTYEEDSLEELIEDRLEEQNPGMDLEVDIFEEVE